ncbi:MAG: FG-GAP-like repeat-containing protein, partial [Planctomycetota bacterium]
MRRLCDTRTLIDERTLAQKRVRRRDRRFKRSRSIGDCWPGLERLEPRLLLSGADLFSSVPHVIDSSADGANSVYAADLDGDGDLDVLTSSSADNRIAWYANDGSGAFSGENVITINADD